MIAGKWSQFELDVVPSSTIALNLTNASRNWVPACLAGRQTRHGPQGNELAFVYHPASTAWWQPCGSRRQGGQTPFPPGRAALWLHIGLASGLALRKRCQSPRAARYLQIHGHAGDGGGYHMETRLQSARNGSLPDLVSGIVDDIRTLIRQEMALGRAEVLQQINKTKKAAIAMSAGIGAGAVGVLFLLLLLVHLIHEAGGLPLWGSYAIVGGILVVIGCILFIVGKRQASEVNLLPHQTIESIRENVQWIKDQT